MYRDELFDKYIKENMLFTSEVCQILGVSRQQISNLVKQGKLSPLKENANAAIFLKSDIDAYIAEKMSWNIHYRNEIIGNGNTFHSRKHFDLIEELHDEIVEVHLYFHSQDAMFDGYYTLQGRYQRNTLLGLEAPTCVMKLTDGKEYWYNGFNCGYGGTGPNGSYDALIKLRVPEALAKKLFYTEKISFYKVKETWEMVNRADSIAKSDYPDFECNICLYNNRLVLVQTKAEKYKKERKYGDFLEKYNFFIPKPIEITFFSREEALNTGHYVSTFRYSTIYQIVIKDVSGNELWLDYQFDENLPIKKQQNIEEIMKKIGIEIPKNKESLSERIKEWLNIVPVITDKITYRKKDANMSYFTVTDENQNIKSYTLDSYEIIPEKESIIVKFHSGNITIGYELQSDMRFRTCDIIYEYMENLLNTIVSTGHTLKIIEYFARCYVTIGYETDEDFHMKQFTARKLVNTK